MGRHSRKRRYIRHNAAFKKSLIWTILIAAAVPGVLSTAVLYDHARQALDGLAADTAILSAMYTVPDRAFEQLRERFAQPSAPPQPEQSEQSEVPEQQPVIPQQPQETEPPAQTQSPPEPVQIPEEYRGTVVEEDLSAAGGSLQFGSGKIKNATSLSAQQVEEYLAQPQPFLLDQKGPQVLIMHTHATESFEAYDSEIYDTRHTWRSTDNSENIVAAGEVMAQAIRAHGIEVLHDDTQHDYPSYNGSYERSAATVKEYLAKYPSIKVVLDVHRDAVQRDSTLVKPVTQINGKKAAQMMIIAGCDDGTMEMPNWGKNLRFAAGIQDAIESRWQGLTRPIFFCYRKYNQDLTTGSLLLELGSHGNTLEQVLTTAQLAGDAIGSYLAEECAAE